MLLFRLSQKESYPDVFEALSSGKELLKSLLFVSSMYLLEPIDSSTSWAEFERMILNYQIL